MAPIKLSGCMTTCDLQVVENMQGGVVLLQDNTLLLQRDDQLAARLGNLCTFTMLSRPCAQLFLVVYRQGMRGATKKFGEFKRAPELAVVCPSAARCGYQYAL